MKAIILFSMLGYLFSYADMAYLDMNSFFNVKGNLTKISWAHAVNNQTLLRKALDSSVMMLEADVVIGNLTTGNSTNIPIMAHPPATTSDLSLRQFLTDVHKHNDQSNTQILKKGVKLDFKSINAVEQSVSYIETIYATMNYPVWLNADILPGPQNAEATPVDPARFFNATKSFTNSTLSIGWTTNFGSNTNTSYSNKDISSMLTAIKSNNVTQRITFPVRAGIAASSITQMKNLIANISHSTLTIWSGDGDPVNVTDLRSLIKQVGINRTFLDVNTTLQGQLNLQTLGAASSLAPLVTMVLSALALFLVT